MEDQSGGSRLEGRRGVMFGVAAYTLWGGFPLYWPLLKPANAVEILAQRMLWSLLFVVGIVAYTRAWGRVRAVVADRRKLGRLAIGAVVVSINWGVYIWGVNSGHVIETSLGYFINPLFTVLLGVILLGESLRRVQWIAVGIGALAIVVLTIDYGRLPWIALVLAASFGLYGYQKKRASVGAVESLAVETGCMAVPAALILTVLGVTGRTTFASHGLAHPVLLAGTGLITAVPLLLFGAAARRLPLTTLGLIQYLAPVLQFAVGVGIDHEPLPPARLAGFALVWTALVILSVDGVRTSRRAAVRRRSAAPVGVGATR